LEETATSRLAVVLRQRLAAAERLARRLWQRLVAWFKAEFEITGPITWATVAQPRNLVYLGPPLFWLGVLALQLLPARNHGWRSIVIVLTVALVAGSLRVGEDRHPLGLMRGERLFRRICIALAAVQLLFCIAMLVSPDLGYMATTTLRAGRIMISGGNPYAEPTDPLFEGPAIGEGYKLPPLMAAAFLPLGFVLGARGVILTNLILQGLVAATIFYIARSRADRGQSDGVLAVLLYLALPIVPFQIFARGATDLLPVLLALIGILLANRQPLWGGLAAGLSCSAGLMPGGVILPLCVPATTENRERFTRGLVFGLLPLLLFFLRGPEAFAFNVLGLGTGVVEQPGSSLVGLSVAALYLIQGVAGMLWIALGLLAWRRPLTLEQRCGLAAVVILSAILIMPMTRPSETLWWLPLAAIAVTRPVLLELTRMREGQLGDLEAERLALRLQSLAGGDAAR